MTFTYNGMTTCVLIVIYSVCIKSFVICIIYVAYEFYDCHSY